jgi:hypothetical protein
VGCVTCAAQGERAGAARLDAPSRRYACDAGSLQAVYDQLRGTKNALRKLTGKRVGSACLLPSFPAASSAPLPLLRLLQLGLPALLPAGHLPAKLWPHQLTLACSATLRRT